MPRQYERNTHPCGAKKGRARKTNKPHSAVERAPPTVLARVRCFQRQIERSVRNSGVSLVPHEGIGQIATVMRASSNKRKKLNYPEETEGSRLAAKVRKLAGKLTADEEAEYFRRGMTKIYGDRPKEISGAGH